MALDQQGMLERVRRALGRTGAPPPQPAAPPIPDALVRLVPAGADLVQRFIQQAGEIGADARHVSRAGLLAVMVECLKASGARRIAMSDSRLLDELHVADSLAAAGLSLKTWDQITLDEMYDFDAAVTDVTWAVAETGSLVISTHGGNGRALSLTPKIHVAIVRTEQILPDLVDLFEKLGSRSPRDYTVIISGPSKTADIEMNVVTGVHGPNVVQIYVID